MTAFWHNQKKCIFAANYNFELMKVKTAALIAAIGCCLLVAIPIRMLFQTIRVLTAYAVDLPLGLIITSQTLEVAGFTLLAIFFFNLYKKL